MQYVSPGILEITAESESARSATLNLDIPLPNGVVATLTPTVEPTGTATPLPSTATPLPPIIPTPEPELPPQPGLNEWLIAVLISLGLSFGIYRLAAQVGSLRWGIRAGFLSLIGGLLAYSYLAAELPGSRKLLDFSVSWSIFIVSAAGIMIGLAAALCWRAVENNLRRRKSKKN